MGEGSRTPSVVAVGPQRTATTWLDVMLRPHPALCFPEGVKETFFFDRYYAKGPTWYARYFRHASSSQQTIEVAPSYFDDAQVPERLREANPDARIVISLREPVERARSLFHHHLQKGRVPPHFTEAAARIPRIVTAGHYREHIPRWLEAFGPDRVLVILLDDTRVDPARVLERVCHFIGVGPIAPPADVMERVNEATYPRFPRLAHLAVQTATVLRAYRLHQVVELGKRLGLRRVYTGRARSKMPGLEAEEVRMLRDRYAADVEYVEGLLGRPLPHWR